MREHQFDGLPGPTHNYAALSHGNVASMRQGGRTSSPRAAVLQGLAKMRFVRGLGVAQAVLPPHPRPSLRTLRRLGFHGADEEVLAAASRDEPALLRLVTSASAMWTANAATVAPSCDAADGRLHLVPANLCAMFHRSIEAETTTAILRRIFANEARFVVHDALPDTRFGDEGAANHTRLATADGTVHLFGYGRSAFTPGAEPSRFPARQTLEASRAVARLGRLAPSACMFVQQDPAGIDDGAFHTDVLAVGNGSFLMLHERAFLAADDVVAELSRRLGPELRVVLAREAELPTKDAVSAYPFNSQVLDLPDGTMAIIAPQDAADSPRCRAFLERVVAEENPVRAVHWLDLRQSMDNGGGPACLRLRVPLTEAEVGSLGARVVVDEPLLDELSAWATRHYRDRLAPEDLADPSLHRESMAALDALTAILRLGSVYDFQRP